VVIFFRNYASFQIYKDICLTKLTPPLMNTMYEYDHMTMSRDTEDDEHDQIEVLSSQIIYLDPPCTPPISAEEKKKEELERRNERERRKVSRVVAVVSVILMISCVALICISFMISSDIDDIGKIIFNDIEENVSIVTNDNCTAYIINFRLNTSLILLSTIIFTSVVLVSVIIICSVSNNISI